MDARRLIETLVRPVTPNATVVDVVEGDRDYAVTNRGTAGVVARCEVPRDAIADTADPDGALRRVSAVRNRCADTTVATVPDGQA